MSGVLQPVHLEDAVSRGSSIALVRATGASGMRMVPGKPKPCSIPWQEYEVVEVLRAPKSFQLPHKIQVEPADARWNCQAGEAMNGPIHPILLIESYVPLDSAGLGDPSGTRVLFLRGESPGELAEVVRQSLDGPGAVPRIRALLAKH